MVDSILLAGASGFIGRVLFKGLAEDYDLLGIYNKDLSFVKFAEDTKSNRNLESLQCDLSKKNEINKQKKLLSEYPVCIFLAANTFTDLSVKSPTMDIEKNILTLTHLLETYNCKRFINISSGAVYEGNIGSVTPFSRIEPTLPYAVSKYAAEGYVKNFALRRDTIDEFFNVRFFGAFGEFEPERKLYRRVIKASLDEKTNDFRIFGNGKNYIDAMVTDDAVAAIRSLLKTEKKDLTLDLSQREPKKIHEMCSEVFKILKRTDIKITLTDETVPESNLFYSTDNTMSEIIGWEKKYTFEEGIKRTVERYI